MFIGWRMWVRARATIAAGMVAENSMVWRVSGVIERSLLDVGQEAEVEHLVGLVEDEGVDVGEVEGAAVGEVDQPAGRADDDVDAALERLELRLVGDAAVDGEDAQAAGPCWPGARSLETWSASSRVGATISACGLPCGRSA